MPAFWYRYARRILPRSMSPRPAKRYTLIAVLLALAAVTAACGRPSASSLRDSFAQQLAANRFIRDFQRNGDELTFTGPGAEGGQAKWRIHIDSASVETNTDEKNRVTQPYRGIVRSSWYSDGQLVEASGRESHLPIELTDNGLGQDCWAFWDEPTRRWTWE
jgi:hypothetical protein